MCFVLPARIYRGTPLRLEDSVGIYNLIEGEKELKVLPYDGPSAGIEELICWMQEQIKSVAQPGEISADYVSSVCAITGDSIRCGHLICR